MSSSRGGMVRHGGFKIRCRKACQFESDREYIVEGTAMTVAELIEHLTYIYDKSLDVWVAKDAEGNGFNPLYEVSVEQDDEDDDWALDDTGGEWRVVLWP